MGRGRKYWVHADAKRIAVSRGILRAPRTPQTAQKRREEVNGRLVGLSGLKVLQLALSGVVYAYHRSE